MKIALLLVASFICAFVEGEDCPSCLFPLWYSSANLKGDEFCRQINVNQALSCLNSCDLDVPTKPESYKIRQLTQLMDILIRNRINNCTVTDSCSSLFSCYLPLAHFEWNGITSHAPFTTVFKYNCSSEILSSALACANSTNACVSGFLRNNINSIVQKGIDAACNNPRRCVTYGNIYEVKPGTNCVEYFQEAAAYGPSTGIASKSFLGLGFDPSICRPAWLNEMSCPADPAVQPIFSEFPPPSTTLLQHQSADFNVKVNLSLSCEKCLHPVWERAVTYNGSQLCAERFISLVISCLNSCKEKSVAREQLHSEVLVKISDLNKAFFTNKCPGYSGCSSNAYNCSEQLVEFNPMSAPHVTVNKLNCSLEALDRTLQCFIRECDQPLADLFRHFLVRGFGPVCESRVRCMSFGNIYEYVPVREFNTTVVPCANYRQAPANGWHVSAIARVQPGLVFNVKNCQPDWPYNVQCPSDITSNKK